MNDPATPVLYTQRDCADSPQVRAWLTERGIEFTERDVTTDLEAARALYETGTFATPLLVSGETKVLGFRPDTLAAALGREHRGRQRQDDRKARTP